MTDKKRGWQSKGAAAYNWNPNPGYRTLHRWVYNNKPKVGACENCGVTTAKLECANISGVYTRDLDDYRWLCRTCHMRSDGRVSNLKQGINAIVTTEADRSFGVKTCSKCKIEKPLSDYPPNKYRKSGIQSYCRECAKIMCRELGRRTNWGKNPVRGHRKKL